MQCVAQASHLSPWAFAPVTTGCSRRRRKHEQDTIALPFGKSAIIDLISQKLFCRALACESQYLGTIVADQLSQAAPIKSILGQDDIISRAALYEISQAHT